MATKLIRAKGGSSERIEDIASITIPDLWHIAMRLKKSGDEVSSDMVLDTWYLAHDLLRAFQRGDNIVMRLW